MYNTYNDSWCVGIANICEFTMGSQVQKKKKKIRDQLTNEGPWGGLVLRLNVQMY
jgi:hypothetical protein